MCYISIVMSENISKIADQVMSLSKKDYNKFLSWLFDYEIEHMDDWDKEIERDLIENVRLKKIISDAEEDIKKGRIKPLDEVIHNS